MGSNEVLAKITELRRRLAEAEQQVEPWQLVHPTRTRRQRAELRRLYIELAVARRIERMTR